MSFRSSIHKITSVLSVGILATAGLTAGEQQSTSIPPQQDPAQQPSAAPGDGNGPWAPVGQGQAQQQNGPYNQPGYNQQPQPGYNPQVGAPTGGGYGPYAGQAPYGPQAPYNQGPQQPYNQGGPQAPYNQSGPQQPMQPLPAQLTVPAGTFVTVRVNQTLSSDHNQPGDGFSATLVQPVVANGVVIAEPGQTIAGQVVEAQKAGRVEGVARLKVQLTEITLIDGQQLPLRSALVSRNGGSSVGRDASAIAGTTGLGAAIGAAAGWGTGAAIGAGAGAVAGTVGVLLTRGHASIIAPEQILTFRIEAPLVIDTTRSTQAFRYIQPNEYDRPFYSQPTPGQYAGYGAPVAVTPAPYYYGYPYYYAYGPNFSFFWGSGYGRGFYGGRAYYGGRGFYGGGLHHR